MSGEVAVVIPGPDAVQAMADDVPAELEAAEGSMRTGLAHAVKAGRMLIEAKADLPHGMFQHWLAKHVRLHPEVAQNYMRLARELPKLPSAKVNPVSHLSLRDALAEIAKTHQAAAKLPDETLGRALKHATTQPIKKALKAAAPTPYIDVPGGFLLEPEPVPQNPGPMPDTRPPLPTEDACELAFQLVVAAKYSLEKLTTAEVLDAINLAYVRIQEGDLDASDLRYWSLPERRRATMPQPEARP